MQLGYAISSEEHAPLDLVENAVRAEGVKYVNGIQKAIGTCLGSISSEVVKKNAGVAGAVAACTRQFDRIARTDGKSIGDLFAARVGPFQALLTQLVPGERRGALMSIAVGSGQLGFALGGTLAALTYERWGYNASTTASAAVVFLSTLVVMFFLPEPSVHPQG